MFFTTWEIPKDAQTVRDYEVQKKKTSFKAGTVFLLLLRQDLSHVARASLKVHSPLASAS
jgi:hypothetical protein